MNHCLYTPINYIAAAEDYVAERRVTYPRNHSSSILSEATNSVCREAVSSVLTDTVQHVLFTAGITKTFERLRFA